MGACGAYATSAKFSSAQRAVKMEIREIADVLDTVQSSNHHM